MLQAWNDEIICPINRQIVPPRLQAVWPDLAKFRHFGKVLKVFEKFLKALISSIWQNFQPTLAIFYAIMPICSDWNGQIIKTI